MNIKTSPWGDVEHQQRLSETDQEVYVVQTPSHGGLVIKEDSSLQRKIEDKYEHTKLYQNWVQKQGGLVFYEEDCACLLLLATINPDKYEEQLSFWLKKD